MWEKNKQRRLNSLLLKQEQNTLSNAEADELQSLTDERIRFDAEALGNSTRRIIQTTEQSREKSREIEAQSHALEELIREQKTYLAEVNSLIKEMEIRRRGWRTRYKRVTGRSLKNPFPRPAPSNAYGSSG